MARSNNKITGHKSAPRSRYALGDPEEISNRDKTGFQPHMSSFNQPKPANSGRNLNEPAQGVKSGNFKFNKPVS